MRKLISLIVAIALVMSLAVVAFATEPTDAGEHTLEAVADIPATVTLAAGETATYNVTYGTEAANKLAGADIRVTSDKVGLVLTAPQYGFGVELNEYNSYTWEGWFDVSPWYGGSFGFQNTGTETVTFTMEILEPIGSKNRPDEYFDVQYTNYPNISEAMDYEYYYTYTAGDAAEVLTIHSAAVTYNVMNMANLNFNIIMTRDDNKEVSLWSEEGYADEISMPLAPNQTVIIMVRAAENEPTGTSASVTFKATAYVANEISMLGDYVVEGDVAWYAVNSMLAGSILVVNGDEATIEIDGTVVEAVDGLATAVLNGEGAVIVVKVTGATDMIILPAPTEISAAGDYEATVAAGAEVEYAINSKLAGAILTVKGEGAYIYMNGTKYDAVDGVATAVLDGEGAVFAVKVGNAGTAAGEYKLNIAYAPTVIAAAGDYKVGLAAGAEAEYVVNSKLDGAVVTVKGEGAYLIVDGKKVEAKDGVVTATLEAKAATIKLVVGNAGNAAAEWTINVVVPAGNPETGDFGVIAAVVALATSAIAGTAVVAKKKEN
ncbi:MAG: hypothetical protein IKA47_13240 [Oscillospiraceae bacterium]|nr:hypothetical protein [Oscillospiraceae bacterium]